MDNPIEDKMICACCGDRIISDDPEIADEQLCDYCWREIEEDHKIIGWGKWE